MRVRWFIGSIPFAIAACSGDDGGDDPENGQGGGNGGAAGALAPSGGAPALTGGAGPTGTGGVGASEPVATGGTGASSTGGSNSGGAGSDGPGGEGAGGSNSTTSGGSSTGGTANAGGAGGGAVVDPACASIVSGSPCSSEPDCETTSGCTARQCECLDGYWTCFQQTACSCPQPSLTQCDSACDTPGANCLCKQGGSPEFESCTCTSGVWDCG